MSSPPGRGHQGPLKTVPGRRDQSLLASRAGTIGVRDASRGHDFHAPLNRRSANGYIQALVDADGSADDDGKVFYLFLADVTTTTDAEHPLLAVDLADEPGRTFRVPSRWYADISANVAIANMDFHEFADAADASGTYRGFDGDQSD